jgi:hypothetical protein
MDAPKGKIAKEIFADPSKTRELMQILLTDRGSDGQNQLTFKGKTYNVKRVTSVNRRK